MKEAEREKKFPAWAAAVIAVFGCAIVGAVGYMLYRFISIKKTPIDSIPEMQIPKHDDINEKGMLHTKDGQSCTNLDGTKRVMIRGEEINVQRYSPRTVNDNVIHSD